MKKLLVDSRDKNRDGLVDTRAEKQESRGLVW